MKNFLNRINLESDLKTLLERVVLDYSLETLEDFSIIEIGFEDCNILFETPRGKFLAKIFSKTRADDTIERYANIIQAAIDSGVRHPKLLQSLNGQTLHRSHNSSPLVVLEYVEGKTYFETMSAPSNQELNDLIIQLFHLHQSTYKPGYVFDSWAIPNFEEMYEKVKNFVFGEDLRLLETVLRNFRMIPLQQLPHAFVHGDCTKANVLRGNDGQIYILDFSVANWYPKIQDLAVVAANLLHSNMTSLKENVEVVKKEYLQYGDLNKLELNFLYTYSLAAVAMEFMGGLQEKHFSGNDGAEADYWLQLGREGLKAALI